MIHPFRYDIHFKQSVTAEDIYLGLGNKNPSTASCEEMVVSDFILQIDSVSELSAV